jgi:hypothetical protein
MTETQTFDLTKPQLEWVAASPNVRKAWLMRRCLLPAVVGVPVELGFVYFLFRLHPFVWWVFLLPLIFLAPVVGLVFGMTFVKRVGLFDREAILVYPLRTERHLLADMAPDPIVEANGVKFYPFRYRPSGRPRSPMSLHFMVAENQGNAILARLSRDHQL